MLKYRYFVCCLMLMVVMFMVSSCQEPKQTSSPNVNKTTNANNSNNNNNNGTVKMPATPVPPPGEHNSTNVPQTPKPNMGKDCVDKSKAPKTPCPDLYQPVCGCNGINYSNDCEAQKDGVLKWTPGRCAQ